MEINGGKPELSNFMNNLSNTRQAVANAEPLPENWISALFAKLQGRYGHKWTSSYPPGQILKEALAEWAHGLSGYSGEEIRRGLESWDGDWPPTLPEFRKVCRPATSNVPYHQIYRGLPAPPCDPEVAREQLAKIRGVLKRGKRMSRRSLYRRLAEQDAEELHGGIRPHQPQTERTGVPA